MQTFIQCFLNLVRSRVFFIGLMGVFVVQAVWLALSADYPMAFDEEFHVGVIRIYAEQWSPFLTMQPPGSESFGSLVSDPSYLFHYLMSFPYRVIAAITSNQAAQVIFLRLITITLFAAALVVFRMAMLRLLSRGLVHAGLALMIFIPTVPFLAAQVNYDNGLMLIVALLILLSVHLIGDIRTKRVASARWGLFIALVLIGCIVKYTLLPIVGGGVLFLAAYTCMQWRGQWPAIGRKAGQDWRQLSRVAKVGLCILLVVTGGLFVQKYGTNLVRYGALVPKCHQVLTEQQCRAFGPWGRNQQLAQTKGEVNKNPFRYSVIWVRALTHRLFFTLSGPETGYATRYPLPLPIVAASLTVTGGLVCLVLRPRLLRNPYLGLCATIIVVYGAALWVDNYSQYLATGQPVAINGRYLIPVIPLIVVLIGRAYGSVFTSHIRLKVIGTVIVTMCFLQGGGFMTYILRSDPSWHWQSQTVMQVNDAAQTLLKPLIIEYGLERQ